MATLKRRLRQIVESTDTPEGRAFDIVIQSAILVSIASFSVETLPDLSPRARGLLWGVEVATVALFTAEYLLRLWLAESKVRFVFSFYGLIDLLAILPFYVARGLDLRAVRIFRLFRLIRLLKLTRYSRAVDRFRRAFRDVQSELALFLVACLFVVYLASVGIYAFESRAQPQAFGSVFSSMWWAVATVTTVGYGDVYPVTAGGRLFTALILVVSLGVIAVPSGLIASSMSRVLRDEDHADGSDARPAEPLSRADESVRHGWAEVGSGEVRPASERWDDDE